MGGPGLGSEWHTGAVASGLFLARFVWKSAFPSPSPHIYLGGEGKWGNAGFGGARPLLGAGTHVGCTPCLPPPPPGRSSQVIDQFSCKVRGGMWNTLRWQGVGPIWGKKPQGFCTSQGLALAGLIPVRNHAVNCELHLPDELARLMRCIHFLGRRI